MYCIEAAKSSSERWHCHFVGTCVGSELGDGDGGRLYVGAGVGRPDGWADGIGVGTPLGTGVEGRGVGVEEGTGDGSDVGKVVGTYEGEQLELGDGVGILVGAREGAGVG